MLARVFAEMKKRKKRGVSLSIRPCLFPLRRAGRAALLIIIFPN